MGGDRVLRPEPLRPLVRPAPSLQAVGFPGGDLGWRPRGCLDPSVGKGNGEAGRGLDPAPLGSDGKAWAQPCPAKNGGRRRNPIRMGSLAPPQAMWGSPAPCILTVLLGRQQQGDPFGQRGTGVRLAGRCQRAGLHRPRGAGAGLEPGLEALSRRLGPCPGKSPLCLFLRLIILFNYLFLAAFFSRLLCLFSAARLEPSGSSRCC